MRRTLRFAIGAVVVVYAVWAVATVDRRDDEVVIRELISNAAVGLEESDVGGAMRGVSKDYEDEAGVNYDQLRGLVLQAIWSEINYTVDAPVASLRVDGDRATAEVDARVTRADKNEVIYSRRLTVHFEKEKGRHMWVAPVTVWRVTSVENLALGKY